MKKHSEDICLYLVKAAIYFPGIAIPYGYSAVP